MELGVEEGDRDIEEVSDEVVPVCSVTEVDDRNVRGAAGSVGKGASPPTPSTPAVSIASASEPDFNSPRTNSPLRSGGR